MERRVVTSGEELVGKAGQIAVSSPAARVPVLRARGAVTADLVPPLVAFFDRFHAAAPQPADFYYDLWDMRSYDSAMRIDLTSWHIGHRSTLRSLHTAASSTLVRMGVSVANLALGNVIRQHRDRADLDAHLDKAIAARPTA